MAAWAGPRNGPGPIRSRGQTTDSLASSPAWRVVVPCRVVAARGAVCLLLCESGRRSLLCCPNQLHQHVRAAFALPAGAATPGVMRLVEHDQIPRGGLIEQRHGAVAPLRVPARRPPLDTLQRDVSLFTEILQRGT